MDQPIPEDVVAYLDGIRRYMALIGYTPGQLDDAASAAFGVVPDPQPDVVVEGE